MNARPIVPITKHRENRRMKFPAVATLSLSIFLSACATYPQSQEDQAAYHANAARTAISKGQYWAAADQIDLALKRPTGDVRVKELFANDPKSRDLYRAHLEKTIADFSTDYFGKSTLTSVRNKLTVAKSAGIFSEAQASDLLEKLNKVVANGNITGTLLFDLGDNIDSFPELKSPEHQRIIIDRSIKNLQGNGSVSRPIAALMDYVRRVGKDSAEGKMVESLLPTMNIRRDELDVVARLFPEFASVRKDEITVRVFVQVKNGDRLLTEDLLQTLRGRVHGVEWVPAAGPKTTTVVIERVRNDEKTLPERSQTITYAQGEVNLLSAALLMPRNASYLYEVVSGGAEIEYGYVVSAITDGKTIYDEVIRGKVGGEYRRCQNARIQNVFGGVTSAGFVANDDMQQRCSGPSSASMEDLRNDVFSKIVDGVLKVPPIKVAHELN